jgi:hypothetical protein
MFRNTSVLLEWTVPGGFQLRAGPFSVSAGKEQRRQRHAGGRSAALP